ncbi:MAG: hypothetical protein V4492_04360 [Chlamydiota bacterium]
MAAGSSAVGDRIVALQSDVREFSRSPSLAPQIALTLRVNEILRALNQASLSPDEQLLYRLELQEIHSELCRSQRLGGRVYGLFTNTLQPALPPTTVSPAYNSYAVPSISTYHYQSSPHSIIRCSTSALSLAPPQLLSALGDYSQKSVELHSAVLDARWLNTLIPFRDVENHFNLCLHHWFANTALLGDNLHDKDLRMGIFPELGIERSSLKGAAPYNQLGPMWIHAHPHHEEHDLMLYSPNNAFFKIEENSPLAICWALAEKDNKVTVSRLIILLDQNDPICAGLYRSLDRCDSMSDYLRRLDAMQTTIEQRFEPLLTALVTDNDMDILAQCQSLPDCFKKGILKYIPVETVGLDRKIFISAVTNYIQDLSRLIITRQRELVQLPETSEIDDRATAMMECAEQFARAQDSIQAQAAMEQFNALPSGEKNAAFAAYWEISGCPRGNPNFGRDEFYSNPSLATRAQALLLAASRRSPATQVLAQTPSASQPIALPIPTGDSIVDTAHRMLRSDFQERTDEERAQIIRDTLQNNISAERIAETAHVLVRTFLFSLQTESTRTVLINDLLDLSPDQARCGAIHGAVWAALPTALKERPFSGRNHAGYDVELLRQLI